MSDLKHPKVAQFLNQEKIETKSARSLINNALISTILIITQPRYMNPRSYINKVGRYTTHNSDKYRVCEMNSNDTYLWRCKGTISSSTKLFVRQITVVVWHLRTSRVTNLHSCREVSRNCCSSDMSSLAERGWLRLASTPRRLAGPGAQVSASLPGLGPTTNMKYRTSRTPRAWYMTLVTAKLKQFLNMF